jgi:uncharacterized repeat protein (TIGR01451 family)
VRRLASRLTGLFALSLLAPIALTLSACSGGVAQLQITLTPGFSGAFTPGTTVGTFTVTVINLGPGNASGVLVHAIMPTSFQFTTTDSIVSTGAARTTPHDPEAGISNPAWGVWALSSPTAPNGTTQNAQVAITFGVNITALPNKYSLKAQVVDDNLTTTVESHPVVVEVNQAPRLGVTASVGPTSVHPHGQVTYKITVTNTGSGIAPDVAVLVTLPPMLQFQTTIQPFGGNASIQQPVFPVKGAVLAFYGGFEVPPQTTLGAGRVTIQFIVQCIDQPGRGVYPIQVQVTDTLGDIASITNAAPVNVFGA